VLGRVGRHDGVALTKSRSVVQVVPVGVCQSEISGTQRRGFRLPDQAGLEAVVVRPGAVAELGHSPEAAGRHVGRRDAGMVPGSEVERPIQRSQDHGIDIHQGGEFMS